jgi:hypothetical protein
MVQLRPHMQEKIEKIRRKHRMKEYYDNYSNDKRIKGGKKDRCVLCKEEKILKLSHVVPKWCFKWAKQEDRGRIIGEYHSLGIEGLVHQDGSKHYMLCDDCEQYLGKAENYVRTLMHGSREQREKVGIIQNGELYSNLNVELVQRFVFGLAFKSHFATSAPYHNIYLKKEEIKELRNRILNPIKDDKTFAIIAMRFVSEILPEMDPKAMIIPVYDRTSDNDSFFSFLIAGWEWILHLYPIKNSEFIFHMRLKNDGTIFVPCGDIVYQRFINQGKMPTSKELKKIKREYEKNKEKIIGKKRK